MTLRSDREPVSNVMNLDEARRKRQQKRDEKTCSADSRDSTNASLLPGGDMTATEAADRISGDAPIADTATKKQPTASKGRRSFNREKVERIKAEIARGEYKINYLQVADKYIEHDRFA